MTRPRLSNLRDGAGLLAGIVLTFWLVELINSVAGHSLTRFGLLPRTGQGLTGIIFSPFLHANLYHLLFNTIPFLVLGSLLMLHGRRRFLQVTLFVILAGGSALWLVGRPAYHVGASGLIFGYFGFLVAGGWYSRRFSSLLLAVVTIVLYGGMLWGVMPTALPVSWEGHLTGIAAGVLAARLYRTV